MISTSNILMKKNIALGIKPKKKSIPININSNPTPGKFLISNQINPIASSYLSMGQKIQISKNIKNSKIIHVNTNSAKNYYTMNSKDTKPTSGIITNSLINNYKTNNISDNNGINFNNYYKSNSNYNQQQHEANSIDKNLIKYKNLNINPKHGKNISTISNSLLSNDLQINGYQTSKNNNSNLIYNSKPKNKVIGTNSKSNVSKIRQTYSTRPNFLDSKNKTKKVPMKSKIRQYKYQYKNGKPVSTSFSKVHIIKNNYQEGNPRIINNYEKGDILNNITNENNRENIFVKNKSNENYMINNNIYEIRNKHFRHNTASFDNKDIINIFNKQNFSDKSNKNSNNININYVNNIQVKTNNNNIFVNNIDSNHRNSIINQNRNVVNINKNENNNSNINNDYATNKMSIPNNLKKVNNQYSKGKIGDIKIYINEKKLGQKENKYNQNIPNNVYNTNSNNNNIYTKYHSNNNNLNKDNLNTNNIYHIKNAHSININMVGMKKISVKQKDLKKNNIIQNQNKLIHKAIPTQKNKGNVIPSQRNIKINLSKFLQDVKIKQNNKLVGRKSLSIKRISKENNSDFSLSQLNDKFAQKILKNNDEGNELDNFIINKKQNINKTIQEEIKESIINTNIGQEQNENNDCNIDNNILIDTNYISNMQNRASANRISSMPSNNIIKDQTPNNENIYNNNNNYQKINYNSNASTTNNNYYGNNKGDYSIDNNITDLTNGNNKAYIKNKENINNLNINNNIPDIANSNNKKILNKNLKNEKLNHTNNKNQYNISYENNINITKNNDSINNKKIIDNNINNNLFDEDNLNDLPEDYDENFNDLYSIINKMNFGNVLICVEGYFTPEGRAYKKYKDKFDKYYDKLFAKKGNSFANSNNKPKKIMEGISLTSNTKTSSSSSKKNINPMYNDLNIVKDLNIY